ncbi:hypothetical protein [Nocardia testacea]|uniref:Uncharacterized protein n=1 Tax=Nocardia testacea TaxID=248551 RepID=A0ABW7VQR7_9NOCA
MGKVSILAQSPVPDDPVAPAPAPETVQLVVPPELIEKLAPHDPGFLNQPTATLIAAGCALVAAGVAWWSTRRQIRANAKNVQRQLDAQADQFHRAQTAQADQFRRTQEVQAAKDVRIERLEALRTTFEAASGLFTAMGALRGQITLVKYVASPMDLITKTEAVGESMLALATSVQIMDALDIDGMHEAWEDLHHAVVKCIGAMNEIVKEFREGAIDPNDLVPTFDESYRAWAEAHRDFVSIATGVLNQE